MATTKIMTTTKTEQPEQPEQQQQQPAVSKKAGTPPETLYHVKRVFRFPTPGHANEILQPSIRATYTDLAAAKQYACRALFAEGYQPEQFLELHMRRGPGTNWVYGDGVLVHAKTADEGLVTVELETTANTIGELRVADDGRVQDPLFFLVQTTIDYSMDWSVGQRQTAIQGVFRTSQEAEARARTVLLGEDDEVSKSDFAMYGENVGQEDWPFDANVMVHAVGENGLNILLAVVEGQAS
ncbi:hypothetical protein MPH_07468 [Macrophomina phaseolina MS6]|uniref:Uncharacterized protein n=1 Tax=Macrophomina phaseolina (strain MS6) TaxID=1126212 RepID=K2SER8_MACPH|nr:hypothetical protein MPH_07468 [Macrophomina phaseolina MS6]